MGSVRVRFAPSPTGMLHLGGLRTALINYLFAKKAVDGRFILRIEDTDVTRLVPEATEKIIEQLDWVGLKPDEGPHNHRTEFGPYLQSMRTALYNKMAGHLISTGAGYFCFCSAHKLALLRKEQLRLGQMPRYDNGCRHLSEQRVDENISHGVPHVIRLRLHDRPIVWTDLVFGPNEHNPGLIEGDPILLKSDGQPTYHLANVVDDHLMKITHVLRGIEWQTSTPKHLQLYAAFDWEPPKFAHLPHIVDANGKKLSKREASISIEDYRLHGYLPEAILNLLSVTEDDQSPTMLEMIEAFDLKSLRHTPLRLKSDQIERHNRAHLKRRLADTKLREPLLDEAVVFLKGKLGGTIDRDQVSNVLQLHNTRISRINDLLSPDIVFTWRRPELDTLSDFVDEQSEVALLRTAELVRALDTNDTFDTSSVSRLMLQVQTELAISKVAYMRLLRGALSGLAKGPPVAEMCQTLGRDETVLRIDAARLSDAVQHRKIALHS